MYVFEVRIEMNFQCNSVVRPSNIRAQTHILFTTLTNVKDKDEPEDRPGPVYTIKCSDC